MANPVKINSKIDPELPSTTCFGVHIEIPPPVTVLTSISEARERHFLNSECWARGAWAGQPNSPIFLDRLDQWNIAFDALLKESGHSFTARDRRGAALLKALSIQFRLSLMISVDPPKSPASSHWWDDKLSYFTELLDHIEAAMEMSDGLQDLPPCFSLDTGINLHLYVTVIRCRDPAIRRRAIAILRSANRHEGVLRSDLVAQVAEHIMELEEEGREVHRAEDIPEKARLNDFNLFLDPVEMKAVVRYVVGGRLSDEIIKWKNPTCEETTY